ncbi:unnamed protein product, partial [Staurois parvus]
RVRNNRADKVQQEQAGEWSGIAGVGAGGVLAESGSKQGQQRDRNTGYQVQGLMGNIHQGPDHRPGHSLNTPPAISPRCWLTTGASFWLLRAPAGQPWYCSPHGR